MLGLNSNPTSAEKVANNNYLLTEILIRLPIRSILQFKSVSKHWLSLITDPFFAVCLNPDPSYVSGLFVHTSWTNIQLGFISLNDKKNPIGDAQPEGLTLFPGLSSVQILNSCNGLLCCLALVDSEQKERDVILNPTTKQFRVLPPVPHLPTIQDMCLAFDPSKSPHYKVVCVSYTPPVFGVDCYYQIETYSSETGSWRIFGERILREDYIQFHGGLYWNDAINWFSTREDSLYFHVDEQRLGIMPMLPLSKSNWYKREFRHFGESRGHLHLVEIYGRTTQFNVYEMERNYSGWFVKYRVDLNQVGLVFPEMMQRHPLERRHRLDFESYSFDILSLIRGRRDDDSFLVLHLPGKIIRYNLKTKTFKFICEAFQHNKNGCGIDYSLRNFWFADYYIESLSCV